MKRILSLSLCLLLACVFSATAQVQSITIDASSLEQVHKDAITGLNIDPVGVDRSNRPCARLKIHMNRMSPEDISGLQVKTIGGNVIVMKRQDAAEGNGLIVELTANPAVRFYLHHDRFGDSMPVELNLAPDKEYRIEATLNELYSIIVNTDVADASIVIDGEYKGKTGSDKRLTVPDILSGGHHLQANWNGKAVEKNIFITSKDIFFRVEFPDVEKMQNFLMFQVSPENAILEFDGAFLPLEGGKYTIFKQEGSYPYKATAPDYHTKEGVYIFDATMKRKVEISLLPAFGSVQLTSQIPEGSQIFIDDEYKGKSPLTVEKVSSGNRSLRIMNSLYKPYIGQIVVKDNEAVCPDIQLEPNFRNISLSVAGNADIYVNDELKGTGKWNGPLAYGTYQIECRQTNHRSSQRMLTISPEMTETDFILDSPTPVTGSLKMDSTPSEAQVFLDGELMGETPLYLPQVLVGEHKIEIKTTTQAAEKIIAVEEKKIKDVNLVLNDIIMKEQVITVNGVSFKMMPVTGGTFNMGANFEQTSNPSNREIPVHEVTLSNYYIGQIEVTQELWEAVMGTNPSLYEGNPKNPVENVTWNVIVKNFIPKLNALTGMNFSLPTEAQWEFAARGGNESKGYMYSGSNVLHHVAWYGDHTLNSKTSPVAHKLPNELGIYDMSGNVAEWCNDRYRHYRSKAQINPKGPKSGEYRVIRGGCYYSSSMFCRVSFRDFTYPFNKGSIGFRLVLNVE